MFIAVLNSNNSECHEEALLAIGGIARIMGPQFAKFMQGFYGYLLTGLKTCTAYSMCGIAVGVLGDLCRSLEGQIAHFSDEIMKVLLRNLENQNLERMIRPRIITVLGDIALAVGGRFKRYLPYVMPILVNTSTKLVANESMDLEDLDYLNLLRESILEAYTGVLNGLADDNAINEFMQWVEPVTAFIFMVTGDKNSYPSVIKSAIGSLGDLATCIGPQMQTAFNRNPQVLQQLIKRGMESSDQSTQNAAKWTMNAIQKLSS